MMDLSDGLSTDLNRLCRESKVGAHIYEDRLPLVTLPRGLPSWFDPLELALHGGEDYALLFTVPRKLAAKLPGAWKRTRLTQIGEVVKGTGVFLEAPDGASGVLEPGGWDHFSRK